MTRSRVTLSFALAIAAVVLAGCGSDLDVDTDAVKDGFARRAETAYADAGLSRADDAKKGTPDVPCFPLDDEAVEAIADQAGLDVTEVVGGYLQGAPDHETLSCSLRVEGERRTLDVLVGTTDQTAETFTQARRESSDPPEVLDPDVDGLDADKVAAFAVDVNDDTLGEDTITNVNYLDDGLWVVLVGPRTLIDPDDVLDTLPVVVEQVARVLTDD